MKLAMSATEKRRALIAYHAAGARLGRQSDFEALVRLCTPGMLAHARRLCDDAETARDIVQDAWIAIARALPGLRDETAFTAFALRIVTRRAARNVTRRSRARAADAGYALTRPGEQAAPDDGTPARDLTAAIAALPAPQRVALALFYTEGLSVAEIAHALAIPPGTVKTRLMHARARLRALLEGDLHGQV